MAGYLDKIIELCQRDIPPPVYIIPEELYNEGVKSGLIQPTDNWCIGTFRSWHLAPDMRIK